MKHKHYDMIVASAANTDRVVECRNPTEDAPSWRTKSTGDWYTKLEYRFKHEPKPDIVRYVALTERDGYGHIGSSININSKITFDGETGSLKSLEILK